MDGGTGQGIGAPVRRKEDQRLLTGGGQYSDDVVFPDMLRATMLRSPYAHARIRSIDISNAQRMPGVAAVITGRDLLADGVGPIQPDYNFLGPLELQRTLPDPVLLNRDGSDMFTAPYHCLATDCARFVGDGVAFVVADSVAHAKDAAEAIVVEYEELSPVTATSAASAAGAPKLWEHADSNLLLDSEIGGKDATETAFARAAHTVRLQTWIQRVTGVPMEPRTGTGTCDAETGKLTLYAGSGGVVRQKKELALMLGVTEAQVRVVARDIGGNFGTKNSLFPEFLLVVYAARKLGRPVKWTAERTDCFLSDYQGRDLVADVELALDANGTFLALRGMHLSNVGAYPSSIMPLRKGVGICNGLYHIPAAHLRAYAVVSNTPATIPYRSAGRPESMFIIERLCDLAARKTGLSPVEIRARNLIQPDMLPYRGPTGVTYDNGDYPEAMRRAVELSDYHGFAARKAESAARGKLRGLGLANYIELTMGMPREWSRITVRDNHVEIAIGTLASGQGHETSFAQCVAEWLGVGFDQVRLVQGDTDIVPVGGGSHSGRSMRFASVVMGRACEGVVKRARSIAGRMLGAEEDAMRFAAGAFSAEDSGRRVTLFEIAQAVDWLNDLPDELRGPLTAEHEEFFKVGGYPYGTAVCEVEIDPETGKLELARWTAIDDVGRAVNPMILHGQTHGAAAQGIGQAFWEHCTLDHATGQVLAATLMDYALPRADTLVNFATDLMEVPSPTNPLGVRAGGEGGCTPALGAAVNAVVDALTEFGVEHIDMPTTSEKIWRLIRQGEAA
jgi:aerobic carbon-monoxide dehydrogenase large subunit